MKVIYALNLKFAAIKFKATLPKHHAGIGAVERIIRSIKNTVSKSVTGPNQLKMDSEELHTWLNMVVEKINDRPLIMGAPLGFTLTPNHVLLGFRDNRGDEINTEVSVQHQLTKWKVGVSLFGSLWTQEYTRQRFSRLGISYCLSMNCVTNTNSPRSEYKLFSPGETEMSFAPPLLTEEKWGDAPSLSIATSVICIRSWE